jgi:hypothetical protein
MARIWQLDEMRASRQRRGISLGISAAESAGRGRPQKAGLGSAPRGANGGRRDAARYFVAALISLNTVLI